MSQTVGKNLSIEQFVAVNDELAALARAGVPLEKGLDELARDLPTGLSATVSRLSQRLAEGQSLADAVTEETSLPNAYRAILVAGMRSGQLAAALEGMAHLLRRILETRRMMIAALIYPALVCTLGISLISFTALKCFPVMVEAYREIAPGDSALWWQAWLGEHVELWTRSAELVGGVLIVIACLRWARVWRSGNVRPKSLHGGWPTLGRLMYVARTATMADTMAMLLEHDVPMHEAVELATATCSSQRVQAAGRELAERMRRGETNIPTSRIGVPAVMQWLLFHQRDRVRLIESLRRLGSASRRRADQMARWLSVDFPILVTIGLGGGLTFLYAVSVFYPWAKLMLKLSLP